MLGLDVALAVRESDTDTCLPADAMPVRPLASALVGEAGVCSLNDAAGVIEAIDSSVAAVREGQAAGVVTLPINKKSLYEAGFSHPGHTEYLGVLASHGWPESQHTTPVMMLAGPDLRTIPVTIHIPLNEVPKVLTGAMIVETVRIVESDLRERFGIAKPRIAVSGLNPHAGEQGTMGVEDDQIIVPAIEQLLHDGFEVIGPLPADTMFHGRARKAYDAAVCMYHDQALIPAKTLAFDEAVNVTLGLPFVRTSPDHGTALDIAGTGKANPSSFIAALRMADQMCRASASASARTNRSA